MVIEWLAARVTLENLSTLARQVSKSIFRFIVYGLANVSLKLECKEQKIVWSGLCTAENVMSDCK